MILSDAMLWRMIWKEYRAQRGFWLVIAGFAVVLMLLFMWLLDDNDYQRIQAVWTIAISLPAVYALGCSAVMFATEREEATADFLQIMAARTSRVFLGKVGFSVVSTLAMSLLLPVAAWIVTSGSPIQPPVVANEFGQQLQATAAMIVQFLAWGFLFSAICRKALTAVCLTAVMPLVIFVATANAGFWKYRSVVDIWYWGLLLVVPLVGMAYFLTQRELTARTYRSHKTYTSYLAGWTNSTARLWALVLPRLTRPSRAAVNSLDRLAAVKETSPAWRRVLWRLSWLELRHVFSVGHVLWIAAVYLLVFFPFQEVSGRGILGMFGIAIVPLFMGVWTFQAEQGRRIRFLADHGLAPQIVWLNKQIVWGLVTAALTVPFLVAVANANATMVETSQFTGSSVFHQHVPGASATLFVAIVACLGYAAGQFASMLIPRGVTAGFIGGVLCYALSLWTWLMIDWRVPVAISVVPLIVVMLATTLCWSRHWLLEQSTARAWLKLALALGGSLIVVYAGVGAFRVFEVPRPEFVEKIAPLREVHGLPITPQEAETATLYLQAVSILKSEDNNAANRPVAGEPTAINGWGHATERERKLLAENQEALRQGLAATERSNCAFNDPTRSISETRADKRMSISFSGCRTLATLILLSARELESQGKLDDALDRYVAVLRMARHLANRGTTGEWVEGELLESNVSAWVPQWAAHPDQAAERITAAAGRLGQEAALFPSVIDAVLTEQFMLRRAVADDWSDVLPKSQYPQAEARSRTILNVFDRLCPWEHARALRVLDLVGASELHCLDVLNQGLTVHGSDMQSLARLADAVPADTIPSGLLNIRQYSFQDLKNAANFFAPHPAVANQPERVPWNWLMTTYPLNQTLKEPSNQRLWQMRLARELSLRSMLLRLQLAAFKKTHGRYPDLIVRQDFGMDAIDPYSGIEFGYRREGLPFAIEMNDPFSSSGGVIPAGQPLLWSVGPANVRQPTPMATKVDLMPASVLPDGSPVYKRRIRHIAETPALIFPLP